MTGDSLTERNKASGQPPDTFVRLWVDGDEIWWTPAEARALRVENVRHT